MTRKRKRLTLFSIGFASAVAVSGLAIASALTVAKQPSTIIFTSQPPPVTIYPGGTYTVTVTGAPSGEPIAFKLNPAVCTDSNVVDALVFTSKPPSPAIVGEKYTPTATDGASAVVRFTHAGNCDIIAKQLGNSSYSPGALTQVIPIAKAGS